MPLAALAIAIGAPTASASVVTLTFGGDFSGAGDFNGVNAAAMFTASLTFESTTPDSFPGDPTFGDYAAVTSFSLDVGGFSFSSVTVSSSTIVIVDSIPDDYEATVSGVDAFGDTLDVVLLLSDNDGTAFSNDGLPVVLPFSEFEVKQFSAAILQAGEFNSDLQGTLTSVTQNLLRSPYWPSAASSCVSASDADPLTDGRSSTIDGARSGGLRPMLTDRSASI